MLPLLPAAQTSAFLHGASAFTTVRIQPTQSRHGAALLWPEHLARLSGTCAFLGLPAPAPDLPALPAGDYTAVMWGSHHASLRFTVKK